MSGQKDSSEKTKSISSEWVNVAALAGAASISGLPADIVSFPFSRLKTLRMTMTADLSSPQFGGMWSTGKFVLRTQGISGLFRGMSPVVLSAVPGSTLFFSGAYGAKAVLGDSFIGGALSGFVGQLAGSLVWVPSEVFKELRQMIIMKSEIQKMTTGQLLKHVYQKEGIRGLYRGLPAQLLTFGPFNSLGMALAPEMIKRLPKEWTDLQRALVGNFIAFGFAAFITTPIDVIKTRLQVGAANPEVFKDHRIASAFRQVYKEAGMRGLFNGSVERAMWLGTRQGIAFSTFGMAYGVVKKVLDESVNPSA